VTMPCLRMPYPTEELLARIVGTLRRVGQPMTLHELVVGIPATLCYNDLNVAVRRGLVIEVHGEKPGEAIRYRVAEAGDRR
jgi:hypothetical protein